jgi:hypothetical protein
MERFLLSNIRQVKANQDTACQLRDLGANRRLEPDPVLIGKAVGNVQPAQQKLKRFFAI